MVNDAGYVVWTDIKNLSRWCWHLLDRPRHHLFKIRWDTRTDQVFEPCARCEGSGMVDLRTQAPLGNEFNANATACPRCRGIMGYWRDRKNP